MKNTVSDLGSFGTNWAEFTVRPFAALRSHQPALWRQPGDGPGSNLAGLRRLVSSKAGIGNRESGISIVDRLMGRNLAFLTRPETGLHVVKRKNNRYVTNRTNDKVSVQSEALTLTSLSHSVHYLNYQSEVAKHVSLS